MAVLLLEGGDCVSDRLACVVVVAVLLYSCLHIEREVFLQDVINDFRKGLILLEDGGLLRREHRAYIIHRSGAKWAVDYWMVFAEGTGDGGPDRVHVIPNPRGDNLAARHSRIGNQEPEILRQSDLVIVPSIFRTRATEYFLWRVHVITGGWCAWWRGPPKGFDFFFFFFDRDE